MSGDPHPIVTCARCGTTWRAAWSDADARREYLDRFGSAYASEETGTLCDPCYVTFTKWLETDQPLGPNATLLREIANRAIAKAFA